jgi:hypothetical protein
MPWTARDGTHTTYRNWTGGPEHIIDGHLPLQTLRQYFFEFFAHSEAKFQGDDGRPGHAATRGLLGYRSLDCPTSVRVGKESDPITEEGEDEGRTIEYRARVCRGCESPVAGKMLWCCEACRKRAGRR